MTGYKVEVYSDGDEALIELEKRDPYLIILDHHLNDEKKDGIYYLKKVKKLKPSIPAIYITSDPSGTVKKDALKYGAKGVILKSESFLVQLRTAIDEIDAPKKKGLLAKLFK